MELTSEEIEKLNSLKFDCGFQEDGTCCAIRDYKEKKTNKTWYNTTTKRCCSDCVINVGYLKEKDNLSDEYLKYWTDENGFWDENGCKLPEHMISVVCHMFFCGSVISKYDKNEEQRITLLMEDIVKHKY